MLHLISIGENGSTDAVNPFRRFEVHESFPMLAGLVDDIFDFDYPDSKAARALAIKVLPSTRPHLIVQYREAMRFPENSSAPTISTVGTTASSPSRIPAFPRYALPARSGPSS
jgi:hypothetical protein